MRRANGDSEGGKEMRTKDNLATYVSRCHNDTHYFEC